MLKRGKKQWVLTMVLLLAHCSSLAIESDRIKPQQFYAPSIKQHISFKVILPQGYQQRRKGQKYPVLYTTVGGSRQSVLVSQLDWLSHVAMGPMPKVIVVTLPSVEVETTMHTKFISASGITHDKKLKLLTQTLIPYVDKQFATQPFRIIEGFSSHANFALHVYRHAPHLFGGYIIGAPALALDKTNLVASLTKGLKSANYRHRYLYLSLGDFSDNKPLFGQLKQGLIEQSVQADLVDLSEQNYMSVPLLTLTHGASALFADLTPDVAQFERSGLKGINDYFAKLEQKYGYSQDVSTSMLDLSEHLSALAFHDKALAVVTALVSQHPTNIYYLGRKAKIEKNAALLQQSQQTLRQALSIAEQNSDAEAVQYIQAELAAKT